jgi:diaminopimelate decarboxylase
MKNKEYTAPTVVRHQAGQMNAQAHGQTADFCPDIEGVPIAELVVQHGSPLFVFSEAALRKASRDAHRAFRSRYPDVQFAWSYKTNYLKSICAIFHQEGAIAEVVSDFEYEKARGMGIPGRDIIFNGPWKPPAALERAVDEEAKIQIDNLDELINLIAIAEKKGRTVDVAIRVYMDTGVRPTWTKFGFDADSGEAIQAIKRIYQSPHLRLVGLHTHVGTYILDPEVYARATEKLIDLAELATREYGCDIRYLNLGGGFASHSQLHYQYLPSESVVPSMEDYAEAICKTIHTRWPKEKKLPKLYLETGRALVDEAGYLVTTVVALKQGTCSTTTDVDKSTDGRDKAGYRNGSSGAGASGYLVDSGIHLLYTTAWYQLNVRPAKQIAGPQSERTLFGCLCMNIDVLRQSVVLPNVNVGDQLVLHPVGAYNITQAMQFITYRPRVVMVTEEGKVEVIRERENLEHLEAMERVPLSLQSTQVTVTGK